MPDHVQRQTVTTRRGANHALHIVLTVLTCGLWAITGWPIAAAMGRKTKTTTYVPMPPPQQPYGQQWQQPAPPTDRPSHDRWDHGQQ